jgi:S-adenosylmethionine-diacylglycerol 3-amino-3-carboxypropyl transferase
MAEELESMPASFDFIHLSNVLDWLSPEQARSTLDLAWKALRPGGRVLIRQLNSSLDIPALVSRFTWLADEAAELHAGDRSFFYRKLHLGAKA